MAKILAPNKQYTGLSVGVSFVNGVGETDDPYLIRWFENKGYIVDSHDVTKEETETKKKTDTKVKSKKDAEKAEKK
ncbi:hypothetical protein [Sporosarcina sp. USHLN248]|uniref:hypothetical protein n=1 Tax=Sporosarcina sp. USHLN248 TaxID=3081300 RepID=UPI00301960FC